MFAAALHHCRCQEALAVSKNLAKDCFARRLEKQAAVMEPDYH